MNRVLLVEDEPLVKLALKSLIEWEKYGFEVKLEAANGKKAMEILKENRDIDIVLTDINMPLMNGLELIREIKNNRLNCEIIVLSAYDDFQLVRKAFKLGVTDYVLKTEMEPEKILNLFQEVLKRRNNLKVHKEKEVDDTRKKDFMKKLLNGKITENMENEINKYNLKITATNLSVCYLLIDDFKHIERRYNFHNIKTFVNTVVNSIEQVLLEYRIGEILCIKPKEYALILSNDDYSLMNVLNRINEVIQKIRYILSNYLNINITVGLSHVLNGYGNIPKLYNIAQGNARLRYLIGKGKNISTSERDLLLSIKNIDKDMKSSKFKKLLQIKMEEKKLIDALHLIDKKLVVEELNNILELIDNFNEEKIEDIHIYYIELFLMIVEKTIGEKVEDYKNNYEHMDFLQTIISFETKEEVDRWIINQTNLLLEERLNKYVTSEVDIIRKVRKYIRRNYKNKIKLEMISQYVGLSEGYFSKIFTKNTGENFSTYLTKYRIDKAKELLKTTDKKIYEICDEIGYENVEHFSRTFKKIIGCSPKKYQSQNFVS